MKKTIQTKKILDKSKQPTERKRMCNRFKKAEIIKRAAQILADSFFDNATAFPKLKEEFELSESQTYRYLSLGQKQFKTPNHNEDIKKVREKHKLFLLQRIIVCIDKGKEALAQGWWDRLAGLYPNNLQEIVDELQKQNANITFNLVKHDKTN